MISILKEYKINLMTISPSIFGKSRLNFDKTNRFVSLEPNNAQWMNKIKGIISEHFALKQPILVFFKTKKELLHFQE
jgi:hypothetical protein